MNDNGPAGTPFETAASSPQPNELDRLAALHRTGLLDTEPAEPFDRVTRLAARIVNTPIVLMSLVDDARQWFKSRYGCELQQTAREISFCTHAVARREPLIVPDATLDSRFSNNPLVTGAPFIRAYLGIPLFSRDGHAIGTLCAIDMKPREFDSDDLALMSDLARILEDAVLTSELANQRNHVEVEVVRRTRQLQVTNDALRLHVKRLLESERTARATELRLRSIADGVPAMIGYWNRHLRCEFANQAYCDFFGIPAEQVVGMTMSELMGELFAEAEPHTRAALEGHAQRFDRHIRSPGTGGLTLLEVRYVPDLDDATLVRGFYSLVIDTTPYRTQGS